MRCADFAPYPTRIRHIAHIIFVLCGSVLLRLPASAQAPEQYLCFLAVKCFPQDLHCVTNCFATPHPAFFSAFEIDPLLMPQIAEILMAETPAWVRHTTHLIPFFSSRLLWVFVCIFLWSPAFTSVDPGRLGFGFRLHLAEQFPDVDLFSAMRAVHTGTITELFGLSRCKVIGLQNPRFTSGWLLVQPFGLVQTPFCTSGANSETPFTVSAKQEV
jgi:hypothetical protein